MKYANDIINNIGDFWALASSLKNAYLQKITSYNMLAIAAAAILAIIMETFMIIRLFISHPAMNTTASWVYLGFYVSLIIISSTYLLLALRLKPSLNKTYWLQFFFVAAYLLWNVLLNSYDLYRNDGGSSLAIVTAIIFSSILIHIKPQHMMILQITTYALFFSINHEFIDDKINSTLAVVVAVVANILFYVRDIQNVHNQQRLAQMNIQLAKEQMEGAVQYLKRLQETQKQTAIYRHDLRHTLNLVEQLAIQGNLEKLQHFISKSQDNLQTITPDIICEHETANLILGSFKQRANAKNIAFESNMALPQNIAMDDTELCALLCNLLENALLRVNKVQTQTQNDNTQNQNPNLRKIKIKANCKDNKLILVVENGFVGKVKMQDGIPVSESLDSNHGYGIQSIISIVERNHGIFAFETDNQIFKAKILLHL